MPETTFFWHDYETFGANPRRHRPAQFAGLRTDTELRPIGEPLVVYCQPTSDHIPEPEACLITGITPQLARERGVPEPEFAAIIHDALARPGTCGAGYNSIRFDDEVTRFLLYRNFYEPYQREYADGNSRWDLIDVVRLCYALRPQGLEWPEHEPGRPSFRLEDLARANQLTHGQAHDALSDVQATIDLAALLRRSQPRLFEWGLSLRDKRRALAQLDFARREPLVHVSSRYPAERGCLAVVAPLCPHPINRNGIVVFDLDADPAPLATLPAESLAERVFSRADELPEGEARIPLKVVHANRSPMLAPLTVLRDTDHDRIGLDLSRCLAHADRIKAMEGLVPKLQSVFQPLARDPSDPEEALYDGFIPDADRKLFPALRSAPAESLPGYAERLSDERLKDLLFRYRARHYPQSLDDQERARWLRHRKQRLLEPAEDGESPLLAFRNKVQELSAERSDRKDILAALAAYGDELEASLG